jgi:hypothetical protein
MTGRCRGEATTSKIGSLIRAKTLSTECITGFEVLYLIAPSDLISKQ